MSWTYALLVARQIRFPHEFSAAVDVLALVRVAPVGQMGLHVRLEIVGALEQFAADVALAASRVWRCEATPRLGVWW